MHNVIWYVQIIVFKILQLGGILKSNMSPMASWKYDLITLKWMFQHYWQNSMDNKAKKVLCCCSNKTQNSLYWLTHTEQFSKLVSAWHLLLKRTDCASLFFFICPVICSSVSKTFNYLQRTNNTFRTAFCKHLIYCFLMPFWVSSATLLMLQFLLEFYSFIKLKCFRRRFTRLSHPQRFKAFVPFLYKFSVFFPESDQF